MTVQPQSYEIRVRLGWLRRFARGAITAVGFFIVVGGAVFFFMDDDEFGRFFAVAGIGFISVFFLVVQLVKAIGDDGPDLVIEPQGVQAGGVKVPWPSIWQLVVISSDGTGRAPARTEIGLRLRFGAPLPYGMHHVIYDPAAPQALHLRSRLPDGRLDGERLDAAVRAFAPPEVEVLREDAARPRETARPPTRAGRQDAAAAVLAVRLHDYSSSQSNHFTYKPHPVVSFVLPDGRQVIAETRRPGQGDPGAQVMVSYDADDPADVDVHGGPPKSIRRLTSI